MSREHVYWIGFSDSGNQIFVFKLPTSPLELNQETTRIIKIIEQYKSIRGHDDN